MNIKLLTEHHLEFLSLKGGCRGSSESIHIKMPHCWKSHVAVQMVYEGDLNGKITSLMTRRVEAYQYGDLSSQVSVTEGIIWALSPQNLSYGFQKK